MLNPVRPRVPDEPLAPIVEEPSAPQAHQAAPPVRTTNIINPVPHVELQRTANFPS